MWWSFTNFEAGELENARMFYRPSIGVCELRGRR